MKHEVRCQSRREFLVGSGAVTLAILANGSVAVALQEVAHQLGSQAITAWVRIAADDTVTIKVPATEMGQGVMTALPLILAEELDADWSKVKVETVTGDANIFGNPKLGGRLYTAGSTSVEAYFDVLRQSGAAVRRVLIYTAAQHWSVPPASLTAEVGAIIERASGKRLSFGQIVGLRALVTDVPAIAEVDLKPRSTYRLIGSDTPRLDVPAKTRGAEAYSIDIRIPDMVHAAILRAPVEGEAPASVDDELSKAQSGVVSVVRLSDAVAVVARRWDTALAARDLINVEWTRRSPFRQTDSAADLAQDVEAARDVTRRGVVWIERGEAIGDVPTGGSQIEAEYSTEHVYHAQLEPLAAVAKVDADGKGAEIWIGSQSQSVALEVATHVLGTTPDRVRFHFAQMGGAFGRRTMFARELLRDALLISREVRRPIKLMWTREDDVRQGWFRPATAHKLRAALDRDGQVVSWQHRVACPSLLGVESPEALARFGNRDALIMGGTELAHYSIANVRAEHIITPRRARIAAWRGIGHGHNQFAVESFIDELAAAARSDPVRFRRSMLDGNHRMRAVLDKVVTMSNFGAPPEGRAHGISLSPLKNSMAAGVAEIALDRATGIIRVHRFWAAIDVGLPVQPRNLIAQVEGGIVFGLSGLLKERITIRQGEVQQSNFHDYSLLRASEIPEIEVEIVSSDARPSGAGELGVPITGAAVANAFYALTGKRLRQMPFDPARVNTALAG